MFQKILMLAQSILGKHNWGAAYFKGIQNKAQDLQEKAASFGYLGTISGAILHMNSRPYQRIISRDDLIHSEGGYYDNNRDGGEV